MQTNPLHPTAKIQQTHLTETQQIKTQQTKITPNQNTVIKKRAPLAGNFGFTGVSFFYAAYTNNKKKRNENDAEY